MMFTYSFAAEYATDVEDVVATLRSRGIVISNVALRRRTSGPDVAVECSCELDYAAFRLALADINNAQLMIETLRAVPLRRNPLTRGA